MDQFTDDLKKIVQAGIGAVSTAVEKGKTVIDEMAKKGEPLYEQAKACGCDVVEKVKNAVAPKADFASVMNDIRALSKEDRAAVKEAILQMEADEAAQEQAKQQAQDDSQNPPDDHAQA